MFWSQWTIITLHTTYNEIFWGIQPSQDVKVFPTFQELTLSPSSACAGGLAEPNHQHTLTMGTELGTKTSENLHILVRLYA